MANLKLDIGLWLFEILYAMHSVTESSIIHASEACACADSVIEQTFRTWQRSFCPCWNAAANPGMSSGRLQQSSACRRPRTAGDTASHTQSAAESTTYLLEPLILKPDGMRQIACISKRCNL